MSLSEPEHFRFNKENNTWACLPCASFIGTLKYLELRHAVQHETSNRHVTNVRSYLAAKSTAQSHQPTHSGTSSIPTFLEQILALTTPSTIRPKPPLPSNNTAAQTPIPPLSPVPINEEVAYHQTWQEYSPVLPDRDDDWINPPLNQEPNSSQSDEYHKLHRARAQRDQHSEEWFPWIDRIECSIDLVSSLPRTVFSESELSIFLWLLEINGVASVPTVGQMKNTRKRLHELYGVKAHRYMGSQGHTFFVNDLGQLPSQEMSNTHVRPHLKFYPEESGRYLKEAWQAWKWLHNIDPNLLTPMIRVNNLDYYIFEPTLVHMRSAINHVHIVCMPTRWYTRRLDKSQKMYGRAWRMREVVKDNLEKVWVIDKHDEIIFSEDDLVMPFTRLEHLYASYELTSPYHIAGYRNQENGPILAWDLVKSPLPNQWRVRAKGRRVLNMMIWLYCDDTSGNRSKKWNEHYSYLFTLAGLPRAQSQREYNVHFLCTSNLASPLELLEGVVDQFDKVNSAGIPAYDSHYQEEVLLFVSTLAFLGDNPMQSEIACHVGLQGKFFCRICLVYGRDVDDGAESEDSLSDGDGNVNSRIEPEPPPLPALAAKSIPKTTRKRAAETRPALYERVLRFMRINPPRRPIDTLGAAVSMYDVVRDQLPTQRWKELQTATGVKDTFLNFFLDRVDKTRKGKRAEAAIAAVEAALRNIPTNPYSPIYRLPGLDMHQDTPCEILHVLLLGIIKYFWRDAVASLSDDNRTKLKHRLSSIDLTGLTPLLNTIKGHTLVQYAGSLVGCDFRIVIQVAPFVLYDLVPDFKFSAWLALGSICRLAWQPEILDVDVYTADLTQRINNLLDLTAKWDTRWFNKPKFHILLHLVEAVPRFGPPILYATETFESWNAIIRGWSIHSNRSAPSKDIASSAAMANRIRHVSSGGYLLLKETAADGSNKWKRCTAGPGLVSLLSWNSIMTRKLGIPEKDSNLDRAGECDTIKQRRQKWIATRSSQHCPIPPGAAIDIEHARFQTWKGVVAKNGDTVHIDTFCVIQLVNNPPMVGRLKEVIQREGGPGSFSGSADYVLVELFAVGEPVSPYNMPRISSLLQSRVASPLTIVCPINVQHNCAGNKCALSGTHSVRQERETVEDQITPATSHINPLDLIINTIKLRDAVHTNFLIPGITLLDREETVHASVYR